MAQAPATAQSQGCLATPADTPWASVGPSQTPVSLWIGPCPKQGWCLPGNPCDPAVPLRALCLPSLLCPRFCPFLPGALGPLPALHLLPALGQEQIQWTLLLGNWEWLVQLVSRGLGAPGNWEGTRRMQKLRVVALGPGGTLGWEPGN